MMASPQPARPLAVLLLAALVLAAFFSCTAPPEAVHITNQAGAALSTVAVMPEPTPTLAEGVTVPPPLRQTAAGATVTAAAPATPTPSPTATLPPSELIAQGQQALYHEDFGAAVRDFEASLSQPGTLSREQQAEALWGLSLAYLRLERFAAAGQTLQRYEALAAAADDATPEGPGRPQSPAQPDSNGRTVAPAAGSTVAFFRGQAQEGEGRCAEARESYARYLQDNPDMAAYIQPMIARCALAEGDEEGAIAAFAAALEADAHRLTEIENRQVLASYYLDAGDYAQAVAQYDAIHNLAVTENTRGQMTYRAGAALIQAGETAAGYERYLVGINSYPRAYESYLGLVELLDAGYDVSLYQRGLVDYYARAYAPAVTAFESYLAANAADYLPDAHLYLAWSYEALGNTEAALAQFDRYAATDAGANAARALAEKASFYSRAGMGDAALQSYLELRSAHPDTEQAAEATWQAALLYDARAERAEAMALYWALVEEYPQHEQVPRALFRAGLREWQEGQTEEATAIWQQLAAAYPAHDYGAAALIWLLRTLPEEERDPVVITATALSGVSYYPLRAQQVVEGEAPFTTLPALRLEIDEAAEQAEADGWLRARLGLEEGATVSGLSAELGADARLQRGQKLWQLGLYEAARRELEAVREAFAGDVLATYQIALFFRDLGLYRSSILAAERVMALTATDVFAAPRLIGRLSYPVYFRDLVLPLAERYGYDPLLQFALIRQESLFESFVSSSAGAQGLSQVMPGTGDDIARQLSWPDYDNADLYRPYVGVEFGAYYLSQQLRAFDGSVYAALSAYNGGPGNAARWYAAAGSDPDLYLETVDFRETRTYIQRIYTGYTVYQHLYGGPRDIAAGNTD
jgi:soluble lytic murein transglycosylase